MNDTHRMQATLVNAQSTNAASEAAAAGCIDDGRKMYTECTFLVETDSMLHTRALSQDNAPTVKSNFCLWSKLLHGSDRLLEVDLGSGLESVNTTAQLSIPTGVGHLYAVPALHVVADVPVKVNGNLHGATRTDAFVRDDRRQVKTALMMTR